MLTRQSSTILILFAALELHASPFDSASSDTVFLSLEKTEKAFLAHNLRLIAGRFGVDAARAAVVQAGLWSNPNVAVEQNVYNQFTGKYFDASSSGNTEVQVQQLFLLAGKREKEERLAEIGAGTAQENLNDALRILRHELRTDFFDLYYRRRSMTFYDRSIATIQRTVTAIETVYAKRAVLLSEVVRLKSLLLSLEKERLDIASDIFKKENNLRLLLNDSTLHGSVIVPLLDQSRADTLDLSNLNVEQAVAIALENRSDYRIAEQNVLSEEANLSLQEALAFPDITVGGRWSRAGSYIPNYYAITLSVDLPFLNRNQGNVEASVMTLEANKRSRDLMRKSVQADVADACQKAVETDRLYKSFDRKLVAQYEELVEGMVNNYERRNIGIVEFTDFFEAYRTSMVQIYQLENNRLDEIENLNAAVGADIVEF